MSTSRLLIAIAVLTVLFTAGKAMFHHGTFPSALELPDVQPATDHGGGISAALSTERGHRLEADLASSKKIVGRIVELESRILQLESNVAALGAALAERTEKETDGDSPALQQPTRVRPPPEETLPDDNGQLAAMRTAFLDDPIDPQWATETSFLITGFFENGSGEVGVLRAVDCRSRYCRVAVGHEDSAAADEMAMRFAMHVADALPDISYHYERQSDGYTDVVMFLARPGQELRSGS